MPAKTVNKQNNTWSLVDSEFLFSCSPRRLRFLGRELFESKFTPIACFCNDSTLFLISSLIANGIYDFFSWMEDPSFLHSSFKSTVLSSNDLLRLDDKQNDEGRW